MAAALLQYANVLLRVFEILYVRPYPLSDVPSLLFDLTLKVLKADGWRHYFCHNFDPKAGYVQRLMSWFGLSQGEQKLKSVAFLPSSTLPPLLL